MNAVTRSPDAVVVTPVQDLADLLVAVRDCRACEAHLPFGPRPVLQVGASARVLVVGQAPGARVHASGIAWDDASGERLRAWTGLDHLPLPHPSARNTPWFQRNPWFEQGLLPALKQRIAAITSH